MLQLQVCSGMLQLEGVQWNNVAVTGCAVECCSYRVCSGMLQLQDVQWNVAVTGCAVE